MRLVLALTLLLAACEPPPPPVPGGMQKTGEVVVTVDGETVTQDMIDAVTRRAPEEQMTQLKADEAQYKQFIERIGLSQALYNEAIKRNLHQDPAVKQTMAMAERDILANELLETIAKEAVTDEKVKEAYEAKKVQFSKPSVKLRHIIVADPAEAQKVADELKAGGDFEALAKQHSIDGGQRSDLGWVEQGRLIPELSDPSFAANAGDIVGPIVTRHGNHVIKVEAKRDSTPLEDVRPQLEESLKQEAVEGYIQKLKGEMKVEWPGEKGKAEVTPTEAPASPAPEAPAAHPEGSSAGGH